MNKYPITVTGEIALKEELRRLKSIERPRIIQEIATARALGDLKENAEYHAAREEQSFTEGRILEIESKLANAQVIDITHLNNTGKVIFGATVTICNMSDGKSMTYQIVGEDEANIKQNKISYASPLGRALIAKQVDDNVIVTTPCGLIEYEILSVDYACSVMS